MMVIDNEFDFGDIVYLKTDEEQKPHIVSKINLYKGGEIVYGLINCNTTSDHYGFELSKEKNLLLVVQ